MGIRVIPKVLTAKVLLITQPLVLEVDDGEILAKEEELLSVLREESIPLIGQNVVPAAEVPKIRFPYEI